MTRSEICSFLQVHDNYVILTHRRPDGDTTGCAAALCRGLRQMGKTAFVFANRQFTAHFLPLVEDLLTEAVADNACVISVDMASLGLMALNAEDLSSRLCLAIDHHGSNDLAVPKLVEPDKAACGEIIFALLQELGVKIDSQIADALYTAISTDTGCFKYSNTSSNTLHTAAALIDCGAHNFAISKALFDTKSFGRLKLEAYLTNSIQLLANGTVGLCTMPQKVLDELSVTEDDIDSISGFPREVEGVEIGIMIRDVEGGNGKISLRTSPNYNASAFCAALGGGGHVAAAGATVPGGIEAAKNAILTVLAGNGIKL